MILSIKLVPTSHPVNIILDLSDHKNKITTVILEVKPDEKTGGNTEVNSFLILLEFLRYDTAFLANPLPALLALGFKVIDG